MPFSFSVIIITRDRPEMLKRCIDSVIAQDYAHKEIIVADSSKDSATRQLVESYGGMKYVQVTNAHNNMPKSRNVGIGLASGDVIVFIDDDAAAHPGWMAALAECYNDPEVGGAGGLAVEKNQNTVVAGGEVTGRVYPDGRHVGNFTITEGPAFDVDWVPGCNMSWRREVVQELNGFDEGYTITNACEERDFATRVRLAGWRVRYHPKAGVDHYAAPKAGLRRDFMDPKVHYSVIRNNTYFNVKNFGLRGLFIKSYLIAGSWGSLLHCLRHPSGNNAACLGANLLAKAAGVLAGLRYRLSSGHSPQRKSGPVAMDSSLSPAGKSAIRVPGEPR